MLYKLSMDVKKSSRVEKKKKKKKTKTLKKNEIKKDERVFE